MKNYVKHELQKCDKEHLKKRCGNEGMENLVKSLQEGYFKNSAPQESLPTDELKQGFRRYRKSNNVQRRNCIRNVLKELLPNFVGRKSVPEVQP